MSYKDPEKQKAYDRERKHWERVGHFASVVVLPHAQSRTESHVLPVPNVLPLQLSPQEPYDEAAALKHMMSMHPVYSDKVITTSGGVVLHPVIGWQEGKAWNPTPVTIKVDKTQLARLKKVIKDMDLVKVV